MLRSKSVIIVLIIRAKLFLQRATAAEHDGEHGHVDLRRPGLRPGEGRARDDVLHSAPDPVLGHHHHDQHR